ncbi:acyltransferase [Saccharospirillum impatiens]|uniref:acyltransferase n=1 Tax=Saccharospirillum impatiens TaxID=169438 RepID=UPI0004020838|nr:acyltransferase [Saccharospirillum impatiens]
MVHAIASHLMGVVAALALLVHTMFLGVFLYFFIVLRSVLRFPAGQRWVNPCITEIAELWMGGILWWLQRMQTTRWDIQGLGQLNPRGWYLVTANHQSWADIFVLFQAFHRKIPLLKFFIKKQMARIPVVGQAWWALDFPFMERHSRAYLKKHPEKAGQDLLATQRACEKFSAMPTSVMNFLEGTRFSALKHREQGSPFWYLLKPKAGGIAFTIKVLGSKFSALTNVTIVYPQGVPTFWDLLCGRMKQVTMRVEELPIPEHFSQGDYQNDEAFRQEVQDWVQGIWARKDQLIDDCLAEHKPH